MPNVRVEVGKWYWTRDKRPAYVAMHWGDEFQGMVLVNGRLKRMYWLGNGVEGVEKNDLVSELTPAEVASITGGEGT